MLTNVWLFLAILFKFCFTLEEPYKNLPRVKIDDGNVIFESGLNKDIKFESRSGKILINGKDLISLTKNVNYDSSSAIVSGQLTTEVWDFESIKSKIKYWSSKYSEISEIADKSGELFEKLTPRDIRRAVRNITRLVRNLKRLTQRLSKNDCEPNPCSNGATCIDGYNNYQCICPTGWDGTQCDQDVNECIQFVGTSLGCRNGATCRNLPGSYACDCPANWYGQHCTEQHDDCATSSNEALCGHGICHNLVRIAAGQPKYTCVCDQGWKSLPPNPSCNIDIDECNSETPHCSIDPPVECINYPGGFRCGPCPNGYRKLGNICVDIDECLYNNGGCSKVPLVQCINTRGSNRCGPCPPGYLGDGRNCFFRGVCLTNNGGCHPLANCIENNAISDNYRRCECPPNYYGNGIGLGGCMKIELTDNSTKSPCNPNPCLHGTCTIIANRASCNCYPGWLGKTCSSPLPSYCVPNPCQNGASCSVDSNNQIQCDCINGYYGPWCQYQPENCGGHVRYGRGTMVFPKSDNTEFGGNRTCVWRISVNDGKVIQIKFVEFNLESGQLCEKDYLQVYDGLHETDRVIGKYCGDFSSLPNNGTIQTSYHHARIKFHSDFIDHDDKVKLEWSEVDGDCGGSFTNVDHGTISSPGFPNPYPTSKDCKWKIQVSFSKRIQLNFATLQIGNHDECHYDWLKVYDGPTTDDPTLVTYCNSSSPPPLVTSGSFAMLHFHSDDIPSDSGGFQITFSSTPGTPNCGGFLTSDKGTISSPNFPLKYDKLLDCEWSIRIRSPGDKIELKFTQIDLEYHPRCDHDYIEIRDGIGPESPLIGKYCHGRVKPPENIISTKNALFIRFHSDWNREGAGFHAVYETYCGGQYLGDSGIIKSPNFPYPYPDNKRCIYHIKVSPSKAILVTFLHLDIEPSPRIPHVELFILPCSYDYLELYGYGIDNATFSERICGKTIPEPIETAMNELIITFVTDGSKRNSGFMLNYTTFDVACGGILRGPVGTFQSPSSDNMYLANKECNWLLIAPAGFLIQLTFPVFSIEPSSTCRYDYVEVREGNQTLGKYCGDTKPQPILSTNEQLIVKFVTDTSNEHEGFVASYIFLNGSQFCGGTYHKESGFIASPNYPRPYPHKRKCAWTIQAPQGRKIQIKIIDFQLEPHKKCLFDSLSIYNGQNRQSPKIGTYCGETIPESITSHGNAMFLEFKSDSGMAYKGFKIEWDTKSTGCGGILTSFTGVIQSPNYPDPYHHNAECVWKIHLSRGSRIRLAFVDVEMERTDECNLDYVEVYDEPITRSPPLARVCHNGNLKGEITSQSNVVTIKMRTDVSIANKGFKLNYWTLCENELTGIGGIIESPNYPNNYPPQVNCSWNIKAPKGNNVSLIFPFFNLLPDCKNNFVRISEAIVRRKICAYDRKNGIISTATNKVKIEFSASNSDLANTAKGFRLEWKAFGCGNTFYTSDTGEIKSPNYPNSYNQAIECMYHIRTRIGSKIILVVDVFDIEQSNDCKYDSLKFFGGPDTRSPLLTTLCGKLNSVRKIISQGNEMTIVFSSDISMSGKGFRLFYSSVLSTCGQVITLDSGIITSPNYPAMFDSDSSCYWIVRAPNTHLGRYQIKIEDLSISSSINCTSNYIAFYSKVYAEEDDYIGKFCGQTPPTELIETPQKYFVLRLKNEKSPVKFKVSFREICGSKITQFNGRSSYIFNSPNYPNFGSENAICNWTFSLKEDQKLMVSFNYLLSRSSDCFTDYLEVHDGDSIKAPMIGKFCGASVPPPIISEGNSLHFSMVHSIIFSGRVTTEISTCGANFIALHGAFVSPSYPRGYPVNTECVWEIDVSEGNRIALNFDAFELQESERCSLDYLEIREVCSSCKLLGRFCGSEKPKLNQTEFKSLWIKFKSGDQGTASGFAASWYTLFDVDLFGEEGVIQSPGYPLMMHSNYTQHRWKIVASNNKIIAFKFERISIPSLSSSYCLYGVTIYNGLDENFPVLGRFCGHLEERIIRTSSNVALITADAEPGVLFSLFWSAQDPSTAAEITPKKNQSGACSRYVKISRGKTVNITSPGYPHGYGPNIDCTWYVYSPRGMHPRFTIHDMRLEVGPECGYDNLTFSQYNYFESKWQVNQTICANQRKEFEISSRVAKLKFMTDARYNKTGFNVTAFSKCGSVLIIPFRTMTINTSALGNDSECEWIVMAHDGRTVKLNFTKFHIGSTSTCRNAFFEIKNGRNKDSPPLGPNSNGKYCGSVAPVLPESSSQFVYIRIVAPREAKVDFELVYREVSIECGGELMLKEKDSLTISSPTNLDQSAKFVTCDWIITGPADRSLRIDFLVDRYKSTCNINETFVSVHDGGSVLSPLLTTYCPQTRASGVETSQNIMFVRYLMMTNSGDSAFSATISTNICGGTYHISETRQIASPNYPKNYDNNLQCEYYIHAKSHQYILFIHIDELDLSNEKDDCTSGDYVEFRNGDASGKLIGRYCGNTTISIQAEEDTVYMMFKSDNDMTGKGFVVRFHNSQDNCGSFAGIIDFDEQGTIEISSPRFPQPYPGPRSCHWPFFVAPGYHVEVIFSSYNLKADIRSPQKCIDKLDYRVIPPYAIRRTPRTTENIIHMPCNVTGPMKIISPTNDLSLTFETSGLAAGEGFKATVRKVPSAVCGGIVSVETPNFESPNFDKPTNGEIIYCLWEFNIVTPNRKQTFVILLKNLEIPGTSEDVNNCEKFYLRQGFRSDQEGPPYCGNKTDVTIIPTKFVFIRSSLGNIIYAKLNRSNGYRGVRGILKSFLCGGRIMDSSNITSPNYPSNYPSETTCIWNLFSVTRSRWVIKFNDFSLEDNCDRDWLEIYEGSGNNAAISKRYCGSSIPETLTIIGGQVSIRFQSDAHTASRGFNIDVELQSFKCGGRAGGVITSPSYPFSYNSNLECIWFVRLDPGYHIRLEFAGRFDIEESMGCSNDYVMIEEMGLDKEWTNKRKYCGLSLPESVVILTNEAKVTFRSNDNSAHGDGFKLNVIKVCGQLISSGSGSIESPGYPEYQSAVECKWTFKTKPNDIIRINFVDFELEESYKDQCSFDNVTIHLSENTSDVSKMLGPYCGLSGPDIIENRGIVIVKFRTDRGVNRRGFKFNYKIILCGGYFNGSNGLISSPNIDDKYANNAECDYIITVPEGYAVKLRFLQFSLYKTNPCPIYQMHGLVDYFFDFNHFGDELDIWDGNNVSNKMIGRFCGYNQVTAIKSSENSMFLRFFSDGENESSGFTAMYTATFGKEKGCGGVFNSSTGTIQSPQISENDIVDRELDCIWHIIGSENKVIKLTFDYLKIKGNNNSDTNSNSTSNCNSEYLDIRDGLLDSSSLLEILCGDTTPSAIYSGDFQIRIHYHSESFAPEKGFKLNYEIIDPVCGGNYVIKKEEKLVITSPDYPQSYPPSLRCKWSVRGFSAFLSLKIKFTDLDIDCEHNNRLEVYVRRIEAQPFRICGNTKYPSVHIPEMIDIIFSSDPEPSFHHGFSAEIEIYACNQTYTDDSGSIMSENYPYFSYSQSSSCLFNISVPVNRTITVYFHDFQFELPDSVTTNEVKSTCPTDQLMEVRGGSTPDVTTPESILADAAQSHISASFVGDYCGSASPNPIFSTTNFLSFTVKGQMFKYHLTYTSTNKGPGCGGNLTASMGTFTSPFYPTAYNRDEECVWTIRYYGYHTFNLEFAEFSLSPSGDCYENHLEIYDGPEVTDSPAGRYCGQNTPAPFKSHGNVLTVKMKTSSSNTELGFKALFKINEYDTSPKHKISQINPESFHPLPYGFTTLHLNA